MNRLIIFIKKIHLFVIFLIIELVAINHFSHSSIYTNAKMMNASNYLIGGVYTSFSTADEYLSLKETNQSLTDISAEQMVRIRELEREIDELVGATSDTLSLHTAQSHNFKHTSALVINNSVSRQHNYITLSKGSKDGVEKDMAIIHNNSIVGYTADCSENYSVGISILNTDFKSSGKDANDKYFGALTWDGISYKEVVLNDIPGFAQIAVGDTIVTTSFSPRFPENINIGVVKSFELTPKMTYSAKVELSTDMSSIHNVVLIKNNNLEEITELEESLKGRSSND